MLSRVRWPGDPGLGGWLMAVLADGYGQRACLYATVAALRAGCLAVVFGKFAPDGRIGIASAGGELVASRLGADVTRRFGSMLAGGLAHMVHRRTQAARAPPDHPG